MVCSVCVCVYVCVCVCVCTCEYSSVHTLPQIVMLLATSSCRLLVAGRFTSVVFEEVNITMIIFLWSAVVIQ